MKKYPPLEIVAPLVFAFVFAVTLIYSRFEPHVEDVNSDYVKQYTGRPGYVLVDVRPEENFEGQSPMFGVPGGPEDSCTFCGIVQSRNSEGQDDNTLLQHRHSGGEVC